MNFMVF